MAFYAIRRDAAPGVDGMMWRTYEADLDQRIADLHDRVQRGAYRALPSRRTYIPKPDGSGRWRSPPSKTRSSKGRRRRC
jgi:retron-type reverse transcriptase